jgi:hypothetical protein
MTFVSSSQLFSPTFAQQLDGQAPALNAGAVRPTQPLLPSTVSTQAQPTTAPQVTTQQLLVTIMASLMTLMLQLMQGQGFAGTQPNQASPLGVSPAGTPTAMPRNNINPNSPMPSTPSGGRSLTTINPVSAKDSPPPSSSPNAPTAPTNNGVKDTDKHDVKVKPNGEVYNVPYADIINQAGRKYGVPPKLIAEIIRKESFFKNNVTSSAGARGLIQLMPITAKTVGVTNVWDPVQNIEGGTKYIAKMLREHNNNLPIALAAYNAGPGNVKKYGGIPPFRETQNYVRTIMQRYQSA